MQDRFVSPRPTFQAPSNASALEAITPRPKDTTPAPSVAQRVEESGDVYLASLLVQAQDAAREHAKVAGERMRERLPRRERFASFDEETEVVPVNVAKEATPKFQPSDVLDDATFIRKTRDTNFHTPEMQALFWANGGERHMVAGLNYAQAYDNLRQEKMRNLRGSKTTTVPYQRSTNLAPGAKTITPGMPTQDQRIRQREAQVRATRIVANERWAGIKK